MTFETSTRFLDWTAQAFEASEFITPEPVRRLAALLDRETDAWSPGVVPPLGHWLYFLPEDPQSRLGEDGHPERGELLPPISAPHRMWAGGRIAFHAPLRYGAVATRSSRAIDVRDKLGRSGQLTFVTVRHEITTDGELAVVEEQDLVFRENVAISSPPDAPAEPPRACQASRTVSTDTRSLFRFSALTNNAHRIHYDRDYARVVEGYPDLVVHGPFQAMLLMTHLLDTRRGVSPSHFSFRGARPLFVDRPFSLNLADDVDGVSLWTSDEHGSVCFRVKATIS